MDSISGLKSKMMGVFFKVEEKEGEVKEKVVEVVEKDDKFGNVELNFELEV